MNFLLQTVFTLGVIVLFGGTIALCNRTFYRGLGANARAVCVATGFLGTPVHEASHALMCLLFGHKILKVRFFTPSAEDGTLGCVVHSYDRRNLYQRAGNLFIGIAPILAGTLLLGLLLRLLLPAMFTDLLAGVRAADFTADFGGACRTLGRTFAGLFSYAVHWQWWVFLLLGSFIGLHMTLSRADLAGALDGLIVYCLLFLAADAILFFVGGAALAALTDALVSFGTFLLFLFCLFVLIALALLLLSALLRRVIGRKA